MKNMNWNARLKNRAFWITIIPAVLLMIQVAAEFIGYTIDLGELGDKSVDMVNAVFSVLVILGVVADPTTEGFTDSEKAEY